MTVIATIAVLVQPPQAAQAAVRWRIENYYYAGRCADGNSGAGGQAYIWSCVRATNQYFYFEPIEGYWRMRNVKTGLCLGSNGTAGFSPIYNLPCDGNWATHWAMHLMTSSGGRDYYTIQPRYLPAFTNCFTPSGGTNGVGLFMDTCVSEPDYWTWYQV
ncbi:hypothetical protein Ate01nite_42400 [Actinoplanes teichomyceticus]|nr:hypothetical protein Ate01nite_42400 [Actinoplanes teichomyceticus]